jgi:cation diffusion facilitator CzcD-associated flavoprotein CzcO
MEPLVSSLCPPQLSYPAIDVLTADSYATGPEIHQYLKKVTREYNLDRDVQLNSEVKSAIWDEDSGTWKIQVLKGAKLVDDWCHVLLNGSGVLKYALPPELSTSIGLN